MTDSSTTDLGVPPGSSERKLIDAARREAAALRGQESALPPVDMFPGYRLVREIHRGGQGIVYEAIQESTRRTVAIKTLLSGSFAHERAKWRFEQEARVIASLKHPHIVVIHDSGIVEGHCYFVMDYVCGEPCDTYIRIAGLDVRETVRKFISICDAVGYAHKRGIIHRDLKPSNILISQDGVPCVLDFGLAKIKIDETRDTLHELVSMPGQLMGTLAYMSPEQILGDPDAVDTRSDVYALGLILYELLTGTRPYSTMGIDLGQAFENIRSSVPARPSRLRDRIPSDLDAVILTALQKEPNRRYQSANEFRQDLESWLEGRPVTARSDSALYVIRKNLAKHKKSTAIILAFLVMLISGLTTSLTFWRRAVHDRDLAQVAQRSASEQAEARRRALYRSRIALAEAEYEQSHIRNVRQLLDLCPEDLRRWEWYRINHVSDLSKTTLRGHEDKVLSVAFTPDGRQLVSGSWDKTIRIWEVATGRELSVLRGHTAQVWTTAVSPDGERIASGSADGEIKLWEMKTGREILSIKAHKDQVRSVKFSPDGRRLASSSRDQTVAVWDLATGHRVFEPVKHESVVTDVAFSPDGMRIAAGSDGDFALRVWDANSGRLIVGKSGRDYTGSVDEGPPYKVLFTSDGESIIVCSASCSVTAIDSHSLERQWQIPRADNVAVDALALSKDGKWLLTGSRLGTIKKWNTSDGTQHMVLRGHLDHIETLVFSPQEDMIASASWDNTVKLWDAKRDREETKRHHPVPTLPLTDVAFSPEGRHLASSGTNGGVATWDTASWTLLTHLRRDEQVIRTVAFSRSGDRIASAGDSKAIGIWDMISGRELFTLTGHTDSVLGVAWNPQTDRLASCSADGTLIIWDVEQKQAIHTLVGHTGAVNDVAYSPDGKEIVSAGEDTTIRLWDAQTGDLIRTLEGHADPVQCAVFDAQGERIASGDSEGSIYLWDAASGQKTTSLEGHRRIVHDLVFGPDGRRLFSASRDWTVRVWDVDSGETLLNVRPSYGGPVVGLALSPDGRTLAAACTYGGTVTVWETQ